MISSEEHSQNSPNSTMGGNHSRELNPRFAATFEQREKNVLVEAVYLAGYAWFDKARDGLLVKSHTATLNPDLHFLDGFEGNIEKVKVPTSLSHGLHSLTSSFISCFTRGFIQPSELRDICQVFSATVVYLADLGFVLLNKTQFHADGLQLGRAML
ncbi:hypothetical protein RRG08_009447 [Elysia crispata]|uniref:Uncharacterized protein n=1 Tax=Elysia crispata TaxID=231223 RepID=A0AAE0YTS8_9GAST|nr:hypothetical protein RRG08_009447 [Elysia crispata]